MGAPNSNYDSLPFLGDPKPELFGKTTLPSISLIGVAAFKQLIDAVEEVFTINIQPTSNYLDIKALSAIGHQPAPMSTLHSEPLPTDKVELFTKSSLKHIKISLMCSHEKRLRTCLPIMCLTIKFTLRMTRCLLIATSIRPLAQSLVSC